MDFLGEYAAWTELEVELNTRLSKNALLANIALYWLSGSGNSANSYYRLSRRVPWKPEPRHRITVPTGVVLTATQPIEQVPREYAERMFVNIRRWEQLPRVAISSRWRSRRFWPAIFGNSSGRCVSGIVPGRTIAAPARLC